MSASPNRYRETRPRYLRSPAAPVDTRFGEQHMNHRDNQTLAMLERARRIVAESNGAPPQPTPSATQSTPPEPRAERPIIEPEPVVTAPEDPASPANPVQRIHALRRNVAQQIELAPEPESRPQRFSLPVAPHVPGESRGVGMKTVGIGVAVIAVLCLGVFVLSQRGSPHTSVPTDATDVAQSALGSAPDIATAVATPSPSPVPFPTRQAARVAPAPA